MATLIINGNIRLNSHNAMVQQRIVAVATIIIGILTRFLRSFKHAIFQCSGTHIINSCFTVRNIIYRTCTRNSQCSVFFNGDGIFTLCIGQLMIIQIQDNTFILRN